MGEWKNGRWVGTGWPDGKAPDPPPGGWPEPEPQRVELAVGLAEGITVTLPDEPALHTRKLLTTLGADFRVDPAAPGSCDHAEPAAETGPKPNAQPERETHKRPSKHTRESVVLDIQQLAEQLGRPPTGRDNNALRFRAKAVFGSWADAVEHAGFPRPRRGASAKPLTTAPQRKKRRTPTVTAAAAPPPPELLPLVEIVDLAIRFLTDLREILTRSAP